MAMTHISVVPAAEITTGRQICLGARDRRQRTTSTHATVAASAMTTALIVNVCSKPGIWRNTLLAILGGQPVVLAIHMNQTVPPIPTGRWRLWTWPFTASAQPAMACGGTAPG